jgi:hypothetical protein
MKVKGRQESFKWEVVNVYGPVQNDRKAGFLEELSKKISSMEDPFIIAGDFNMIRFPWKKSNDNVNHLWMDNFNIFIKDNGVKELHRKGSRFTWSNKQVNPIMSVLDRVLMSPTWEHFYKRSSCDTLTRVGSDHCPLLVLTDDHRFKQQQCFRFEMAWLTQEGFRERVVASWPERRGKNIQDYWRELKAETRKFCKGWGANINSQIKREKKLLLDELKRMDRLEEENGFNIMQWQERYGVEKQLEEIYQFEEIQWQRRGGVNWILKGDSNNGYFHNIANGRKKKCTIFSLEDGDREISDPTEIRNQKSCGVVL